MQQKDEKSAELAKVLGSIIKEIRMSKNYSINQFAHEYDLDVGNTSRIENGQTDIKVVTLWRIAEALNVKPSKIVNDAEQKLQHNLHFFEV